MKKIVATTANADRGEETADDDEHGLPASLKAFRSAVAVATYGSAARAAGVINKSATSITRSIQLLESTLGLPLFERHTRGMVPTAAGRVIVARATRAFDQLEYGAREVRAVTVSDDAARDKQLSRLARLVNGRLLSVLIAVAETGSQTLAAERLNLSQPAISQAIRDLEHLAGSPLVERTSRGVRLTESGEILLRRIKLTIMELRVAQEEVASIHGVLRGRVVVGSLPFASVELAPQAVTQLMSRHAELKVIVVDGTYDSLIYQLRNADIDVIVGTIRSPVFDDIEEEVLYEDTLCVVCRAGHPYSKNGRRELRDVAGAPWVVPLPGTVTRALFEAAFRAENLELPPVRLEVHNPMAVRSILLKSDHLALLSTIQVRSEVASGQLTLLPVALRGTQRSIGLTMRRDESPSPGITALRDELRAAAKALGQDSTPVS